jgi:hypothetical protein
MKKKKLLKKKKALIALTAAIAAFTTAFIVLNNSQHKRERVSSFYRIRWKEKYLRDLAEREDSFVAEYRMSPVCFDCLHSILEPLLQVNETKALASMGNDSNRLISTASRLGIALIILGGGRSMESMRTHGVSKSTAYKIFHSVITAINSADTLAIKCDNSETALQQRANEFKARSTCGLFQYCTGAIDGLAIPIHCPKNVVNQTRYFSGNNL